MNARVFDTQSPEKTVGRQRLLSRLEQARGGGITLLEAPAGYGKTQLLHAWAHELNAAGVRVAWLDSGPDLREPPAFVAALGASIGDAIGVGIETMQQRPEIGIIGARQVSRTLRTSQSPLVVVIDDYHLASNEVLDAHLGWLFRQLSARVQVVLVSRSRVDVTLGEHSLRSRITRMSALDLRLTDSEVAQLFDNRLDPQQVARVVEWTEGWPAAACLIRRRMLEAQPLEAALTAVMTPSDATLARYISEQVIGLLPISHQQVLTETAFLTTLDADLVQSITDIDRPWDCLADCDKWLTITLCEHSDLAKSQQYRCHPLVRQTLLQKLAGRGTRERARLQHRAAVWFQAQGRIAEAVSCASAAQEIDFAAGLILASGGVLFGARHGWAALKMLLENLPSDIVRGQPRLTLAQIYVLTSEGHINVARDLMQAVRRHLAQSDSDPAKRDRLLLRDLAFVEIVLGTYTSLRSADEKISSLEAAVDGGDPEDYLSRGVLNNLLGWIHLRHGHFEAAGSCADAAAYYFSHTTAPFGNGYNYVLQGLIALERANIVAAIEHYEAARDSFSLDFHSNVAARAVVDVFLAEAYYEQGRLSEARALCSSVGERLDAAHYYPSAVFYRTTAALAAAEQGSEAGVATLDRGIELARSRGFSELEQLLAFYRVDLAMTCSVPLTAEHLTVLDESGSCLATDVVGPAPWRAEYMRRSLRARRMLREERVADAMRILETLAYECERAGQIRASVEALVLLAIARHDAGSTSRALEALQQALASSVPASLLRPFVEHARRLSPLLLKVRAEHTTGATASFINKVLAIGTVIASMGAISFSQREVEILRQLGLKSENKSIARALRISPETVRFHLKNVYDKLGVKDRALVAEIARERGVIDPSPALTRCAGALL